MVTGRWLDSDDVVTADNCRQHAWAANDIVVDACCRQLATVTTPSLYSHRVVTVPNRWLMV